MRTWMTSTGAFVIATAQSFSTNHLTRWAISNAALDGKGKWHSRAQEAINTLRLH
jgi:hypothetical protein